MEKAKQAVASFVSKDGKHKTTVNEDTRAAITEEQIRPHRHENITTAVDKEVHQDHHHTTIQPIKHQETLPEQHHHNIVPTEHKTFEHGNKEDTRATLDRDAAKFRDTSVTHDTTHSTSTAPVVAGERIHHHVHEHVQPVVQKETIAPQVVHTTVPIHETHHAAPVHHGTSVLPTETMESFTKSGRGTLTGRETTRVGEFDGCPKPYKDELQQEHLEGDKSMHLGTHGSHSHGQNTSTTSGARAAAGAAGAAGMGGLGGNKSSNYTTGTHETGMGNNRTGGFNETVPRGSAAPGTSTTTAGTSTTQAKPSLLDRINPMKDADGDGKKGLMD